MANLEYLTSNFSEKLYCSRPWEREWIEKEKKNQDSQPEQIRLPVANPNGEDPNDDYNVPSSEEPEKRGIVIIELLSYKSL